MKKGKSSKKKLHFSLLMLLVSLLLTFVIWDHYFNSEKPLDRTLVSTLILVMGTLFSVSSGFFVWSLESGRDYLEAEVLRRTEENLEKEKEKVSAEARAQEAQRRRQEIEEAYRKLEEAQDQLIKTEKLASIGRVVAGVVHEFKNPLITMTGYEDLLAKELLPETAQQWLSVIQRQTQRCHSLVQDLLSIVSPGNLKLQKIQICALIDDVLDFLPLEFKNSDISILRKYPEHCPEIEGDFEKLRRVMINLITNAWHALEEVKSVRTITLSVHPEEAVLRVFIMDTGPGIPKENIHKIFEPFFTTKSASKGTGLGLSLCEGILREHRGRIAVESTEGKGTTFLIELPLEKKNVEESSVLPAGKRILVIDDDPAMIRFVTTILRPPGFEVLFTSTAKEGLALLKSGPGGTDLVLLDFHLPDMNGLEVLKRIKSDQGTRSIPVILITGAEIEPEELDHAEGYERILLKPFEYEELQSCVSSILQR